MKFIGLQGGVLVTGEVYKGYVTATGGGDVLPPGWSVAKTGNKYTVIHGLGLSTLTELMGSFEPFSPPSAKTRIIPVAVTANSVVLRAFDDGTPTQTNFSFIAQRY